MSSLVAIRIRIQVARLDTLQDVSDALDPSRAVQRVADIVNQKLRLRIPLFGSILLRSGEKRYRLLFRNKDGSIPDGEAVGLFEPFDRNEFIETLTGTRMEILQKFDAWLSKLKVQELLNAQS